MVLNKTSVQQSMPIHMPIFKHAKNHPDAKKDEDISRKASFMVLPFRN